MRVQSSYASGDGGDSGIFKYSEGLTSAEATRLRAKHGPNALPSSRLPAWYIFLQQLWQPMPILIWIAVIIEGSFSVFLFLFKLSSNFLDFFLSAARTLFTTLAGAIEAYADMGILLGIQFTNASIGFYEIMKAGDAVAKLKDGLKAKATVCRDGKFVELSAEGASVSR